MILTRKCSMFIIRVLVITQAALRENDGTLIGYVTMETHCRLFFRQSLVWMLATQSTCLRDGKILLGRGRLTPDIESCSMGSCASALRAVR